MKSFAVSALLLASYCLAFPSKRDLNNVTDHLPVKPTLPVNKTSTPAGREVFDRDIHPPNNTEHHFNGTHGHCFPLNLTVPEHHLYNCTDEHHHRNKTMPFNVTTPFNVTRPSESEVLNDFGMGMPNPFNVTEMAGFLGMRADTNGTNNTSPLPVNVTGTGNPTSVVPVGASMLRSRQLDGTLPVNPLNVTNMSNSTTGSPFNTTDSSNSTAPTGEFVNLEHSEMSMGMQGNNETGSGSILPNVTVPPHMGSVPRFPPSIPPNVTVPPHTGSVHRFPPSIPPNVTVPPHMGSVPRFPPSIPPNVTMPGSVPRFPPSLPPNVTIPPHAPRDV